MLSLRRNSLLPLCLLLACCQKVDPTVEPGDAENTDNSEEAIAVIGTGEGTRSCPYTVARSASTPKTKATSCFPMIPFAPTPLFAFP